MTSFSQPNNHLVSVIIPTYNAGKYISEAIFSVINQKYTYWELIIVDDGSTDNTKEIVSAFLINEKVSYYKLENGGVSNARNYGADKAKGNYFCFLDADDLFYPKNILEKVEVLQNDQEVGLVHAKVALITESGEQTNEINEGLSGVDLHLDLLKWERCVIPAPSSIMIRREVFYSAGKWDTNFSTAADQDLFIRVALKNKIIGIKNVLTAYRVVNFSMGKNISVFEKDHLAVYEKAKRNGLFPSRSFEKKVPGQFTSYYCRELVERKKSNQVCQPYFKICFLFAFCPNEKIKAKKRRKMKKKKLLYFFYNRLNDPLLQSNIFLYINELSKEDKYEVSIITYEDKKFPISNTELASIKEKFNSQNIKWYPLNWHSGTNLFLKFINLFSGFLKVFYLAKFKGYKNIISLGSVAGSFIYLISKIVRINYYLYQYEPHSEFELDNKIWSPSGLQYKLLNSYEKKSALSATVISSGTDYMRSRLKDWKVEGDFFKITSVANENIFKFSIEDRLRVRKQYQIPETALLIIYPGKLGELYYPAEDLIKMFEALKSENGLFHFLIITPSVDEIKLLLEKNEKIKSSTFVMPTVDNSQMPSFLSAADIGIIAIPPTPSQKYRSPIKVGEYLMCGLPYIVCKGVSEDDLVAEKYNVGIVVENFSEQEIKSSCQKIINLLSEPKQTIIERCRKAGVEYRGFQKQFAEFKKALESLAK